MYFFAKKSYSLRSILLFIYTDVSITKMSLDKFVLATIIIGQREYVCSSKEKTLVHVSCVSIEDIFGIHMCRYATDLSCVYNFA
jgi:hypothetical protein